MWVRETRELIDGCRNGSQGDRHLSIYLTDRQLVPGRAMQTLDVKPSSMYRACPGWGSSFKQRAP